MILNLGCGKEEYGDVRADIARTKATNLICDETHPYHLNKKPLTKSILSVYLNI
jgi:hypothetical protein